MTFQLLTLFNDLFVQHLIVATSGSVISDLGDTKTISFILKRLRELTQNFKQHIAKPFTILNSTVLLSTFHLSDLYFIVTLLVCLCIVCHLDLILVSNIFL